MESISVYGTLKFLSERHDNVDENLKLMFELKTLVAFGAGAALMAMAPVVRKLATKSSEIRWDKLVGKWPRVEENWSCSCRYSCKSRQRRSKALRKRLKQLSIWSKRRTETPAPRMPRINNVFNQHLPLSLTLLWNKVWVYCF